MAQRLDWIHAGRAAGGIGAEDEPHGHGYAEGQHRRPGADNRGNVDARGDDVRQADPEDDAQQAARSGKHDRLHQELHGDIALLGAQGTVANMMFMMPMPPSSSEMVAIAPSTSVKIRWVSSAFSSKSSGMVMAVSF